MKFKSDIEVQAGLKDSSGAAGTSGQVLSSNGTTVSWVNAGSSVASDIQNQVKAGVAINKGQAVYVTGADGTNIIVGLASNTTEATSSKTLGLLNATVAINGFADVVQIGKLSGLNTSAATVGDPVWLGTNGNLIYGLANKPYAPAHLVFIGVVTRVNANNGEIFITVQNGFELNEIHDVDIKTDVPINGDILGYNGTLWVNKTIAEWLGFTPVPTTRTLTINGSTQDLSANRTFTIDTGVTSFNTRTGAVTLTSVDVTTALGYTPVTQARTLTINGVAYDLSANRSWTVPGGVSGSGSAGQVAYWNGTTSITGESNLFWDSTNDRLGIGTTSPSYKLDVNGTFRTKENSLLGENTTVGNSSFAWGFPGANYGQMQNVSSTVYGIGFGATPTTIGTTVLSYNTSGNVGIGTKEPPTRISIKPASSGGNDSSTQLISLQDDRSDRYSSINVVRGAGSYDIGMSFSTVYETAGSASIIERFRINPNGNVGIGTTSPNQLLHIEKDQNTYTNLRIRNNDAGSSSYTMIGLNSSGNSWGMRMGSSAANSNRLDFVIDAFGSPVERMSITSAGNVGIGTTSPSYNLDLLSSNPRLRVKDSSTGYSLLDLENGSGSFYIGNDNSSGSSFGGSAYAGTLFRAGAYPIAMWTNGSERLRITSTGNVGIGTLSPSAKLSVSEATTYGIYGPDKSTITAINPETNGTGAFIDIQGYVGNTVPYYRFGGISGGKQSTLGNGNYGGYLSLWTVSGGENGQADSATYERARIASNGHFGIGTASPSARLSVTDTSNSTTAVFSGAGSGAYSTFNIMTLGANGDGYWRASAIGGNIKMVSNGPAINVNGFSGSAMVFGSDANQGRIGFFTTSSNTGDVLLTESLRINTTGNVLIGTTTDAGYKLDVNGMARIQSAIGVYALPNANYPITIACASGANGLKIIGRSDNLGYIEFFNNNGTTVNSSINGSTGGLRITGATTFSSTVTATGFFNSSDNRLKDIISRDGDVIEFTWKDGRDDKKHIGVIAQEVQKLYPDMVQEGTDEEKTLSVNYIELLVLKNRQLEKRIESLEKLISNSK